MLPSLDFTKTDKNLDWPRYKAFDYIEGDADHYPIMSIRIIGDYR